MDLDFELTILTEMRKLYQRYPNSIVLYEISEDWSTITFIVQNNLSQRATW